MLPFRPTSTTSLGTSLRAWGRARDGGVAVTVAVMVTVLVGVMALSIDVARIYNASTERNNAADAAAVAAATQLDGAVNACNRAIHAAANESQLWNEETFVTNRTGSHVYISPVGSVNGSDATVNPNISFLSDLDHDADGNVIGTYITSAANCDEEAVYVEVVTDLAAAGTAAQVDLYFAGLTGALTEAFPQGYAVAQAQDLFCAEVPLFICPLTGDPDDPNAAAAFWEEVKDYEHTGKGVWLKAENNSDQWKPGNFGFLRLLNNGAKQLAEQMGKVNPELNCLSTDTITTEPGAKESVAKAFNSRMGIFRNGSPADPTSADWQPSPHSIKGYVRTDGNPKCGYSDTYGTNGFHPPTTKYNGSNYGGDPDGEHPYAAGLVTLPTGDPEMAIPMPRDTKSYPGGPCEVTGSEGRMCDGEWQRDVYWEMNHAAMGVGVDDLINFPGVHGFVDIPWPGPDSPHPDNRISRYEMYLWELARPMQMIPHTDPSLASEGVGLYVPDSSAGGSWNSVGLGHHLPDNTLAPMGPGDYPQVGEYAGGLDGGGGHLPQCGTIGAPTTGSLEDDRRVIDVLLVNCAELEKDSGKFDVPKSLIIGSIDMFVVDEWKFAAGGKHDLYLEIIGPGNDSGFNAELSKQWVTLKESRNATK